MHMSSHGGSPALMDWDWILNLSMIATPVDLGQR